ncbi:MAG TPA: hypothetical protein VHI13_17900 [Candidatus Kapabacteria bacterium]|nr:hypothetical protein [Candidatus Kapabacteria bacterium]
MVARIHPRTTLALLAIIAATLFTATATAQVSQPDCDKITASRGTVATGGMIISGSAGSVPGGSTVTITDKNGKTVTVKANADGSFVIKEIDLPDGFDHTIGDTLTVSVGETRCTVKITR